MAAIEGGVPTLLEARTLLDRFHAMVRRKSPDLDGWITDATTSLMASFAAGITKDRSAVLAAIESPWSNGQTEGTSPNSRW
jgi:transposase